MFRIHGFDAEDFLHEGDLHADQVDALGNNDSGENQRVSANGYTKYRGPLGTAIEYMRILQQYKKQEHNIAGFRLWHTLKLREVVPGYEGYGTHGETCCECLAQHQWIEYRFVWPSGWALHGPGLAGFK